MAERTITVEFSGSLDFVIDDEAVSNWDGVKILEVLEKRGKGDDSRDELVYNDSATTESLLGHLGLNLCVENRRMGSFDGWADFPEEAAKGNPYGVHWSIDDVTVGEPS
jgi:hypothetical protein